KEIPRPWTAEVVDRQARVRDVLDSGRDYELASPRLVDDASGPYLTWRGKGPDEEIPEKKIILARVSELDSASTPSAGLSGSRVLSAGLIAFGVILWIGILVVLFS